MRVSILPILFVFSFLTQFPSFAQNEPDWKWQNPLPTGNSIFDVHFIDGQTGWVVGSNGNILKTNNGGTSWILQNSGTTS